MTVRALEHLAQMLLLDVDCACDESRVSASATVIGLNGKSTEPAGVDLVTLPTSEVGEYWPLVNPYNPVVEEQNLQIDIAAQRVDQVISADRQSVAVTVTTHTSRSGRVTFSPVASAGARP